MASNQLFFNKFPIVDSIRTCIHFINGNTTTSGIKNHWLVPITLQTVTYFLIGLHLVGFLCWIDQVSWFFPMITAWVAYFLGAGLVLWYLESHPQYYLVKMEWKVEDVATHVVGSARDLFILLPLFVLFVTGVCRATLVLTNPERIASFYVSFLSYLMIPVSILISHFFRALSHQLFHHRYLYKHVHKKHHLRPCHITPFSTYYDTITEFLVMEAFGSFVLPLLLNPLPLPLVACFWVFQVISALLDHTVAKKDGSWWLNSEYHYFHHKVLNFNFSEVEWFDQVMGTRYRD